MTAETSITVYDDVHLYICMYVCTSAYNVVWVRNLVVTNDIFMGSGNVQYLTVLLTYANHIHNIVQPVSGLVHTYSCIYSTLYMQSRHVHVHVCG